MSGVRQLNWTQNEAGSWWVRTETVGTYFVNKGRWWIKDVTQLIDAGSDDEAKRWAQIDFTMRVMWGIEEGAKLIPPGHIPMPTNAEEARAMALLGERWLKDNAPEELRSPLDVRALAVEIVDGLRGYTCEFSSHPASHSADYDMVEERIRAAIAAKEDK